MRFTDGWIGSVTSPALTVDELSTLQAMIGTGPYAFVGCGEPARELHLLLDEFVRNQDDDVLDGQPPVLGGTSLREKLSLLDNWETDLLLIGVARDPCSEPDTAITRLADTESEWMQVRIRDGLAKAGGGCEWVVQFQCPHATISGPLAIRDGAEPVGVEILPGTPCIECRLETARALASKRGWAQLAGSSKVVALGSEIRLRTIECFRPFDGANEAQEMLRSMVVCHLTSIGDASWWVDRRFRFPGEFNREAVPIAIQNGTREQISLLLSGHPSRLLRSLALKALPLLPPGDKDSATLDSRARSD